MLKKVLVLLTFIAFSGLPVLASSPLTRGTVFPVRILDKVTSAPSMQSSPAAVVEMDIIGKDGRILVSRGTPVLLQIDRQKARGCGKPGSLNVRCVSTTSVDGQNIMLNGSVNVEGSDQKGLALGLGIGLGLTFLPGVGFAFLALKGEEAVIDSDYLIGTVMVMNDYEVQ